jgi:hypothetical protein
MPWRETSPSNRTVVHRVAACEAVAVVRSTESRGGDRRRSCRNANAPRDRMGQRRAQSSAMAAKTAAIIAQIDRAVSLYETHRKTSNYDDLSDIESRVLRTEIAVLVDATLRRVAPPHSSYMGSTLATQVGALRALRRDYLDGFLATVEGLIRGDMFSDFLDMAEYLLEQDYKDPAAVLIGGVLEEHLRGLCTARGLPTTSDGKARKADTMNSNLAAASQYGKLDQKNVTAWLDLRNKAAHGKYDEYNAEQVRTMLHGVREFAARIQP